MFAVDNLKTERATITKGNKFNRARIYDSTITEIFFNRAMSPRYAGQVSVAIKFAKLECDEYTRRVSRTEDSDRARWRKKKAKSARRAQSIK